MYRQARLRVRRLWTKVDTRHRCVAHAEWTDDVLVVGRFSARPHGRRGHHRDHRRYRFVVLRERHLAIRVGHVVVNGDLSVGRSIGVVGRHGRVGEDRGRGCGELTSALLSEHGPLVWGVVIIVRGRRPLWRGVRHVWFDIGLGRSWLGASLGWLGFGRHWLGVG